MTVRNSLTCPFCDKLAISFHDFTSGYAGKPETSIRCMHCRQLVTLTIMATITKPHEGDHPGSTETF
jgi:hypothetical protein